MLAAAALVMLSAGTAQAQQAAPLRGAVAEEDVNAYLLGRPRQQAGQPLDPRQAESDPVAVPPYRPFSEGAVPEETEGQDGSSLADEPAQPAFSKNASDRIERAGPQQPDPKPTYAERLEAEQSALDELTTGTERADTVDSETDEDVDPGAERVEAIEGLDQRPEEDPFAAPGFRAGRFILKPSLEQGVTYSSNVDSSSGGEPGFLSQTTLRLNAVSDWSRHAATLDAYGIFRKSFAGAEAEDAEGGLEGTLDLDLADDYRARASLGYEIKPETAQSAVVIMGAVSQPIRQSLDASLGFEKDAGKARFRITGNLDRDVYGDAELAMGGLLSQEERNFTLYGLALRGGYEISPAVTPFVEAEIGRREYDLELDTAGYARSALRLAGRAGVALDMSEKLSGEVAAGWVHEDFDDDRLASVSAATLDANLNWSPVRGTTVGLNASTTVEGTTTAGESGSVRYDSRLSVTREMRRNLTGTAALGASFRDYVGSDGRDVTLSAEASLTWWLNRYAGVTGRARHETVESNLPDRDSRTNSLFLGLTVRR